MTGTKVVDFDAQGRPVYFKRGEFYVTAMSVKDETSITGEAHVYAVFHEPTAVRHAISSILAASIKGCVYLEKTLREVQEDPDADDEAPSGFSGGRGFG